MCIGSYSIRVKKTISMLSFVDKNNTHLGTVRFNVVNLEKKIPSFNKKYSNTKKKDISHYIA
jgi:hypothetical protein